MTDKLREQFLSEAAEVIKKQYNHTKNNMQICGINTEAREFLEKFYGQNIDEIMQCPTCNGKGSAYDDETGIEPCPDCRGSGKTKSEVNAYTLKDVVVQGRRKFHD